MWKKADGWTNQGGRFSFLAHQGHWCFLSRASLGLSTGGLWLHSYYFRFQRRCPRFPSNYRTVPRRNSCSGGTDAHRSSDGITLQAVGNGGIPPLWLGYAFFGRRSLTYITCDVRILYLSSSPLKHSCVCVCVCVCVCLGFLFLTVQNVSSCL